MNHENKVTTPTGLEIPHKGWDEEDTVIMTKEELSELLQRIPLDVKCSVSEKKGSRPALRVDIVSRK